MVREALGGRERRGGGVAAQGRSLIAAQELAPGLRAAEMSLSPLWQWRSPAPQGGLCGHGGRGVTVEVGGRPKGICDSAQGAMLANGGFVEVGGRPKGICDSAWSTLVTSLKRSKWAEGRKAFATRTVTALTPLMNMSKWAEGRKALATVNEHCLPPLGYDVEVGGRPKGIGDHTFSMQCRQSRRGVEVGGRPKGIGDRMRRSAIVC